MGLFNTIEHHGSSVNLSNLITLFENLLIVYI